MDVNLLPWREAQHLRHHHYFYAAWAMSVFLVFFLMGIVRCKLLSINQHYRIDNQKKVKYITTINATLQQLLPRDNSGNVILLHKNRAENDALLNTLFRISSALPTPSYLTRINYIRPIFLLCGHSSSPKTTTAFVRQINMIKSLKNTTLTHLTQKDDSLFSIQTTLLLAEPP